jgi:hydroxyproline O-arabinosyltransferase
VCFLKGERPAAFPFFYIEPSKPDYLHITEKFAGPLTRRQAEQIAPIGSSVLDSVGMNHQFSLFCGLISGWKKQHGLFFTGNAPTMIRFDDLIRVAPLWMNTSLAIFYDEEANKEWGWVQEMYAFTIACYSAGLKKIDLHKKLMAQPPWDTGSPGTVPKFARPRFDAFCCRTDTSVF